jgi:hypothetical protein
LFLERAVDYLQPTNGAAGAEVVGSKRGKIGLEATKDAGGIEVGIS